MEAPVKGDFRLSRCPATVGGVDIPAGVTLMVLNGAANRDRAGSRTRTSSASSATTRASTSPSAGVCTAARVARSPAWRPG